MFTLRQLFPRVHPQRIHAVQINQEENPIWVLWWLNRLSCQIASNHSRRQLGIDWSGYSIPILFYWSGYMPVTTLVLIFTDRKMHAGERPQMSMENLEVKVSVLFIYENFLTIQPWQELEHVLHSLKFSVRFPCGWANHPCLVPFSTKSVCIKCTWIVT